MKESNKKQEKLNPALYLAYTDASKNKWYALKNSARIPAERALQAWIYSEDSKFGLTREQLKALMAKANENLNRNDLVSAAKIIGVVEAALELYCTEEILLNLASVYFFLNEESKPVKNGLGQDTFPVIDYFQEQKRKIWSEDLPCRSFFLQQSYQFTERYSQQAQLNVLEYLKEVKQISDLIKLHTKKPTSPK